MQSLKVKRAAGHPTGQSDDLTSEELSRIVALPDRRTKDGLRDYAVLLALSNTPMRKGELVRLTVGSLVDEGSKKFLQYKGLKKRKKAGAESKPKPYWLKIPITPKVFEGIMRYVQSENKTGQLVHETPLFLTLGKHGAYEKRAITPAAVDGIVRKYATLAGIKKRITPHSFRATYLTLRARTHDPATLKSLSGHSSLASIMPYLRSSEEKRSEAALSHSVS